MTNSVVLEPMCVPPRRERNRRGAHPSAEGLCCVSIHAARARSLRTRRDGSGPKRFGRVLVLFARSTATRRDETKHPRTCLSRRREGGTRACRTSKRASPRFRVGDFLPSRRVRRRPARKKKPSVCDVYALARTSSTNCPSLPSGPPFPSTRCSPVAILL